MPRCHVLITVNRGSCHSVLRIHGSKPGSCRVNLCRSGGNPEGRLRGVNVVKNITSLGVGDHVDCWEFHRAAVSNTVQRIDGDDLTVSCECHCLGENNPNSKSRKAAGTVTDGNYVAVVHSMVELLKQVFDLGHQCLRMAATGGCEASFLKANTVFEQGDAACSAGSFNC